jgi:hypothetical protein
MPSAHDGGCRALCYPHHADLVGKRIVAPCGLEWDDVCLEFHKVERTVRTLSHAQV